RVVRIEAQRPSGLHVRCPLVAPLQRDPGQPHHRDRVPRVGRDDLAVEPFRLIEEADGQPSLRLQHHLDHGSRVEASGSQSGGSGYARSTRLSTSTKVQASIESVIDAITSRTWYASVP